MRNQASSIVPQSRPRALPVLLMAVMLALAGCANRPESIRASFVSHERFVQLDCADLSTRMTAARDELDKVSKLQDEKANGDAIGVFLLGIPFSKLTGDHEADVARAKGQIEAIETAQVINKCIDGAQRRPAAGECRPPEAGAGDHCSPLKDAL